ncbi:MAG: hypothetical protein ACREUA_03795 [Burkholderiales bacterium]
MLTRLDFPLRTPASFAVNGLFKGGISAFTEKQRHYKGFRALFLKECDAVHVISGRKGVTF